MERRKNQVNRIKFSKNKSKWRNKVGNALIVVDDHAKKFNTGFHIGMGSLYSAANEVQRLGCGGESLLEVCRELKLNMRNDVIESIGATCNLLEVASKALEYMRDQQNTPNIEFPLYTSPSRATSAIETGDRLSGLAELRGKYEKGVDDHDVA